MKTERSLQYINMTSGAVMSARCSVCSRMFTVKPTAGTRSDDMLLRIQAEFNRHDCKEDASQAAARIVREATEDR